MAKDIYGRSRHATQAYRMTSFGKSFESGPSGYGKRLQGAEPGYVLLTGLGAAGSYNIGDLTAGSIPAKLLNLVPIATATITITLYDQKDGGFTPITLCTAAALAAAGEIPLLPASLAPLPRDLTVRVTVAAANAGAAKLLLEMIPLPADWS